MNHVSPDVSIIIPCYNIEKYISRTIKNVLNQTFKNIELIIVDDGSTDNTVNIIKNILDNKFNKYSYKIIQQENSGVSIARNVGLDNSNGKYVFFLDSDDFLELDSIEKLYNKAEKDNLDIVICGYDYVDEEGNHSLKYDNLFKYIDGVIDGENTLRLLFNKHISVWTCSCMYRRKLINNNKLRYYPKCNFGEDMEFIYKSISDSKRVGSVNLVLSHYFQRSSSLSHNFSLDHFKSLGAYNRIKSYFKKNGVSKENINCINDKLNYEPIIIYNRYLNSGLYDEKIEEIFIKLNNKYKSRLSKIKLKGFTKVQLRMYIAIKIYVFNYKIYRNIYRKIYNSN